MEARLTPRQMAKGLLNGEAPPRPLLLPIVFSLGAKVENISWAEFLNNPTKIVSALRQVRNHLQTDGVVCYFDPHLEVEALGATLEHRSPEEPPVIHWPPPAKMGNLPDGLRSPEEAVRNGRIPVAAEVIRRMNALPNREFLLVACVTGPMALAARITQSEPLQNCRAEDVPADALEFAASVATQMATAFLEAGSDLILIEEQIPSALSAPRCEAWANLLAPTINVSRFYEALPALRLEGAPSAIENSDAILQQHWDCVLCLEAPVLEKKNREGSRAFHGVPVGVTLPLEVLSSSETRSEELSLPFQETLSQLRPALITTGGDVPLATDMKHLKRIMEAIPRSA